jgi:hypothetical protein
MIMNKEIKSVEIAELCFNVLSQNMPGWTKGHHKDVRADDHWAETS